MQQPAVARVDQDHAEARPLGDESGLGVFLNGALDDLLRHLRHHPVPHLHFHGTVGEAHVLRPHEGGDPVGEHARVLQLCRGHRPVTGDLLRQTAQRMEGPGILDGHMVRSAPAQLPVRDELAGGDAGRAAQSLPGIVGGGPGRQDVVPGHVHIPCRGGKDPVAEQGVPQSDGFEKMGVLEFAHGRPFLSSFSGPINRRETRGKLSFIPGIRVDAGLTPPSPSRRPTR